MIKPFRRSMTAEKDLGDMAEKNIKPAESTGNDIKLDHHQRSRSVIP